PAPNEPRAAVRLLPKVHAAAVLQGPREARSMAIVVVPMSSSHPIQARSVARPRRSRRSFAAWPLLLLGPACASYPQRTEHAYADFEGGQLSQAYDAYAKTKTTGSEFLSGAEAGTVALAAGRWDDAVSQFDRSMVVAQDA